MPTVQAPPFYLDACFVQATSPGFPLEGKHGTYNGHQESPIQFPQDLVEACPHSQKLAPTVNPYSLLAQLKQSSMEPKCIYNVVAPSRKKTRRRGKRGGKQSKNNESERRRQEEQHHKRTSGMSKGRVEQPFNNEAVQAKQQPDHNAYTNHARNSSVSSTKGLSYHWAPQPRPNTPSTTNPVVHTTQSIEGCSSDLETPRLMQRSCFFHSSAHPANPNPGGTYALPRICPGTALPRTKALKPEIFFTHHAPKLALKVASSMAYCAAKSRTNQLLYRPNISLNAEELASISLTTVTQPSISTWAPNATNSPRDTVSMPTMSKMYLPSAIALGQDPQISFNISNPATLPSLSFSSPLNTGPEAILPSQKAPPRHAFQTTFTCLETDPSNGVGDALFSPPSLVKTLDTRQQPNVNTPIQRQRKFFRENLLKRPSSSQRYVRRKVAIDLPNPKTQQELEDFLNSGHGSPCWCNRHVMMTTSSCFSSNAIKLPEMLPSQQTPILFGLDADSSAVADTGILTPPSPSPSSPYEELNDFMPPTDSDNDDWTVVWPTSHNGAAGTRSLNDTSEAAEDCIINSLGSLSPPTLECIGAIKVPENVSETQVDDPSSFELSIASSFAGSIESLDLESDEEIGSKIKCVYYLVDSNIRNWPTPLEASAVK